MSSTLITTGLACVIAAIVGGGLRAFGIEVPVLQSGRRQVVLGIFGIGVAIAGFSMPDGPAGGSQPTDDAVPPSVRQSPATNNISDDAPSRAPIDRSALLAEKQRKVEGIATLRKELSDQESLISKQEQNIALQEQRVARGEGTPDERAAAQAEIGTAYTAVQAAKQQDARSIEAIGQAEQRVTEIDRLLAQN